MPSHQVLDGVEWRSRAAQHAEAADSLTERRRRRRAAGQRHPVEDFLFDYYGIRAGRLRRWHPGIGVTLLDADEFGDLPGYVAVSVNGRRGHAADPACFFPSGASGTAVPRCGEPWR